LKESKKTRVKHTGGSLDIKRWIVWLAGGCWFIVDKSAGRRAIYKRFSSFFLLSSCTLLFYFFVKRV
jgi:hypothetical protein